MKGSESVGEGLVNRQSAGPWGGVHHAPAASPSRARQRQVRSSCCPEGFDHCGNHASIGIAAYLHRHPVDLQFDGCSCGATSTTGTPRGSRIWHRAGFDYGGHERDRFRLYQRQDHTFGLKPLPQIPPPGVNLRRIEPMPASNGTDTLPARIALRDNRGLHFGRPIPPLARARKHLEPLRALARRIITRDYHSSSAPRPIRARKLGATLQPRKVGTEQRLRQNSTASSRRSTSPMSSRKSRVVSQPCAGINSCRGIGLSSNSR